MNKTQENVSKPLKKRVFHVILPENIWKKFEKLRTEKGFSTSTETVRFLIRNMK